MFILGSHPKIRRNLTKATKEMHFRRQLTAVTPETACVSLNKGKSCFYVQKTHFGAVSSHSRRSSGVFQQVILYRPTGDLCRPMGVFMPSNGGLYAVQRGALCPTSGTFLAFLERFCAQTRKLRGFMCLQSGFNRTSSAA